MKTTFITKSLIAAVLLTATSATLMAQTPTAACPLGHEPGYGRSLDAGQDAALCVERQQLFAELSRRLAPTAILASNTSSCLLYTSPSPRD